MLERHLRQLTEDLEQEFPLKQDERKMFQLQLGPKMQVSVKELDSGYFFFSQIGPLPAKKREELFILLMKANFLGQGTGGSTIGLDEEEKFLTLSLAIPYEMNYKMFKETVEDFANFVGFWREELVRHQAEAEKGIF